MPRRFVSWSSLSRWHCALQQTDGIVSPTRDAVAHKIIELAKAGERDPERLCDGALKATQAPVLISEVGFLELEPVRRPDR